MKKLLSSIMALCTSMAMMAQSSPGDSLLKQYLSVKDALVKSDAASAANAANTLSVSIASMAKATTKEAMIKSAKTIAGASDIEKQRAAFAELSTLIWEYVKTDKSLQQDIYLQYCPMKKTYWMSQEAAIKNPYYGQKMLTCGSVKDKIMH